MNREVEKEGRDKEDEKDKDKRRCKKLERTWANWEPGFVIYGGVVVQAQPWRAASLFQYWNLIHLSLIHI